MELELKVRLSERPVPPGCGQSRGGICLDMLLGVKGRGTQTVMKGLTKSLVQAQ